MTKGVPKDPPTLVCHLAALREDHPFRAGMSFQLGVPPCAVLPNHDRPADRPMFEGYEVMAAAFTDPQLRLRPVHVSEEPAELSG